MYKNDRRMFDRFDVDFSAELKDFGIEEEKSFSQCRDVSASGVGLFGGKRLLPNTNLEISLQIPDGHPPFRGLARIVWSKQVEEDKWRAGLEFGNIDFMGIRRIFATLASRTRTQAL